MTTARRRSIPLTTKLAVLTAWEAAGGRGKKRLCNEHGLSIHQFNQWCSRRGEIARLAAAPGRRARVGGGGRKPRWPALEALEGPPAQVAAVAASLGIPPGALTARWWRRRRRAAAAASARSPEAQHAPSGDLGAAEDGGQARQALGQLGEVRGA